MQQRCCYYSCYLLVVTWNLRVGLPTFPSLCLWLQAGRSVGSVDAMQRDSIRNEPIRPKEFHTSFYIQAELSWQQREERRELLRQCTILVAYLWGEVHVGGFFWSASSSPRTMCRRDLHSRIRSLHFVVGKFSSVQFMAFLMAARRDWIYNYGHRGM